MAPVAERTLTVSLGVAESAWGEAAGPPGARFTLYLPMRLDGAAPGFSDAEAAATASVSGANFFDGPS